MNELTLTSVEGVILASVVVALAGVVRGYAGFGFSALCVASLSFFFPLSLLVPVILLLEVCASVLMVPVVWPHVRWQFVFGLSAASLMAAPLGILVLVYWPAVWVRTLVLLIILVACFCLASGFQLNRAQSTWQIALVGALAGAVNAAGAVGGLVYSVFLFAGGLSPKQFRASLALIFLIVDLCSALMMSGLSALGVIHLRSVALLLLPLALGIAIGNRLFLQTTPEAFKRRVIALLMLLAVSGLVTLAWQYVVVFEPLNAV